MLVPAIAMIAACTDEVPTMYVTAVVLDSVELAPPDDGIPEAFGHYRWELVKAPDGVTAPLLGEAAAITVNPPLRGVYVYDRWFVGEAAEQLSYRVVLTVRGAAPHARVDGPTEVATGVLVLFDGSRSGSVDQLPLTFHWRLAVRPESSAAMLSEPDRPTVSLTPDVPGEYQIELRVFDGELWSAPTTSTMFARAL